MTNSLFLLQSHGILSDHANVRELELLYKEKLFFEVSDSDGETALRGPVRRLVHSDAVEMQCKCFPIVGIGNDVICCI